MLLLKLVKIGTGKTCWLHGKGFATILVDNKSLHSTSYCSSKLSHQNTSLCSVLRTSLANQDAPELPSHAKQIQSQINSYVHARKNLILTEVHTRKCYNHSDFRKPRR